MAIPFEQAQSQLAQSLDKVASGEELIQTRDGRPGARLVPGPCPGSSLANGGGKRRLGTARGLIRIADDFDATLEEFREYMD